MDNIALLDFCDRDTGAINGWMSAPWRQDEGIVATNGHILVCIPDDGRGLAEPEVPERYRNSVSGFLAGQPGPIWYTLANLQIADAHICGGCRGTGRITYETCQSCGGEGDFEHCGWWYCCTPCRGEGLFERPPNEGLNTVPHERCAGTGRDITIVPIGVGSVEFQARYLRILAELPGAQLAPQNGLSHFRFDGGRGCLMSLRPNQDVASI